MTMYNINRIKQIAVAAIIFTIGLPAFGQSEPSPETDCGEYQWPLGAPIPCPNVVIKQKGDHYYDDNKRGDHTTQARYRHKGWDTVVSCENPQIVLSSTPYIPVQRFNGTYYVDEIPYNPTDPTFYINYPGQDSPNLKKVPISNDDDFTDVPTQLGFPFYFFGIRKTQFTIGDNGIVTFTTTPMTDTPNPYCPYSIHTPIPWNTTNNWGGFSSYIDRTHDAIYGVYEDTYTGSNGTLMNGSYATQFPNCGIYYGVVDDYPCRKIIASWNSIPLFGNTSVRNTYQIVCYEGSNIVEVHVKEHGCCPSTSSAIIGIQNATGVPQVASTNPTAPNSWAVINGKPAAFFPTGYNLTNSNFSEKSFRFTPAGMTAKNYGWRRVFDDGRPDVELRNANMFPEAVDDSNGYYLPMDESSTCPTLTRAYVSPKHPTKYVFWLRFMNANNDPYVLTDTIFVGVDTVNYLDLHKMPVKDTMPADLAICLNDTANLRLDITALQEIEHEEWLIRRVSGGDTIVLDTLVADNHSGQLAPLGNNYIRFDNRYTPFQVFRINGNDTTVMDTTLFSIDDYETVGDTILTRQISLFSRLLPAQGRQENKIDTILIQVTADFTSGCHNYDTMMVRVYPNFDTIISDGICRGETYTWDTNGHTYKKFTQDTDPQTELVRLHSAPGCDSIVHLNLKVFDVSYTIDPREDCKPVTWLNGKTYTTSNVATAATDTIVLKNRYDCDSIVQLQLVIHPLKAKLTSDIDHFTLDNLDAVLTDVSVGGGSRVWKFPNGADQTGVHAYYSIPAEMDGANIILIEQSPYGCVDTATIYLPLNKEHFWVPNAFTPDNPAGNNLFASVSTKTLRQEMLIYNRRGELVFRCEGVDCAWDGRDLDGNPCVQDAYVYIIRYTNVYEPKNTRVIKGSVTLIR